MSENFSQKIYKNGHQVKLADYSKQQKVVAIVIVQEDNYRPADVKVRAELSGLLFIAEFDSNILQSLENDKKINRVEISYAIPKFMQKDVEIQYDDSKGTYSILIDNEVVEEDLGNDGMNGGDYYYVIQRIIKKLGHKLTVTDK